MMEKAYQQDQRGEVLFMAAVMLVKLYRKKEKEMESRV